MKSKTSATITPDVETAGKAVATTHSESFRTPEAPISDEKVVADAVEAFDVRPSETVSIVAGNRVLFLGEGLKEIRITR